MWTSRNRARYDRGKLRYPSDVTDEEWELIAPLIPPGKSGGGKRTVKAQNIAEHLTIVPVQHLVQVAAWIEFVAPAHCVLISSTGPPNSLVTYW
jgi:transposase